MALGNDHQKSLVVKPVRPVWSQDDPLAALLSVLVGRYPDPNEVTIDYAEWMRSSLNTSEFSLTQETEVPTNVVGSLTPLSLTSYGITARSIRPISRRFGPGIVFGNAQAFANERIAKSCDATPVKKIVSSLLRWRASIARIVLVGTLIIADKVCWLIGIFSPCSLSNPLNRRSGVRRFSGFGRRETSVIHTAHYSCARNCFSIPHGKYTVCTYFPTLTPVTVIQASPLFGRKIVQVIRLAAYLKILEAVGHGMKAACILK
jgi:hypothetical protein